MDKEEWCDIPGYKGYYRISKYGRARSLDRCVSNGKGERFIKGKILKYGKHTDGYLRICLHKNGKIKNLLVHSIVLTAFGRPPKTGEQCNHKNGIKDDNKIENLEWVTPKENCKHRDNILGKHSRGEKCNWSILTDQKVREIKIHLQEGKLSQREIAKKYNVRQGTISYIKLGINWKHIK